VNDGVRDQMLRHGRLAPKEKGKRKKAKVEQVAL
jgi:hypothetical protein